MTRKNPQPPWQDEVTELNFKDLKDSLENRMATGSPPGSIAASPFACYSGSFSSNHSGSHSRSPLPSSSGSPSNINSGSQFVTAVASPPDEKELEELNDQLSKVKFIYSEKATEFCEIFP